MVKTYRDLNCSGESPIKKGKTCWTLRIVLFFLLVEGKGGARREGGVRFLLKIAGRGGVSGAERPRGQEGVCGELGNLGGGGG